MALRYTGDNLAAVIAELQAGAAGGGSTTVVSSGTGVAVGASNTTYTTGTVVLTGNNLTVSTNGSTIGLSVAAQTNQSLGVYGSSQTTGGASSTTVDARSLTIVGAGGVSVGATNGSVVISGGAGGAAGSNTLGISNLGNTSGTSGVVSGSAIQLALAGGNNVTLSQSINGSSATITISGPNTAAQSAQTLGVYGSSQTTGGASSTTVDARSLTLVGAGNVSVGATNGSVVISATGGGGGFSAGVSNLGNTAGSTGVTGSRLVLAGSQGVSLSQSTDANGATVSVIPPMVSYLNVNTANLLSSTTFAHLNSAQTIMSFSVPTALAMSRIDLAVSAGLGSAANNSTANVNVGHTWVIYTRDGVTLNPLVGSSSTSVWTWSSTGGNYSLRTGPRLLTHALATTLTPGIYYLGVQISSLVTSVGGATTALGVSVPLVCGTYNTVQNYPEWNVASNASSNGLFYAQGLNSLTISNTTQTVQMSNITQSGTAGVRGNMVAILRNI